MTQRQNRDQSDRPYGPPTLDEFMGECEAIEWKRWHDDALTTIEKMLEDAYGPDPYGHAAESRARAERYGWL